LQHLSIVELDKHRLALEEQLRTVSQMQKQFAAEKRDLDTEAPSRPEGDLEHEAQHAMMEPELSGPSGDTGQEVARKSRWAKTPADSSADPEKTPDPPDYDEAEGEASKPGRVTSRGKMKMKAKKKKSVIGGNQSSSAGGPVGMQAFEEVEQVDPEASGSSRLPPLEEETGKPQGMGSPNPAKLDGKFKTKKAPEGESSLKNMGGTLSSSAHMKAKGKLPIGTGKNPMQNLVDGMGKVGFINGSKPSEQGKLVMDLRFTACRNDGLEPNWEKILKRSRYLSLDVYGVTKIAKHVPESEQLWVPMGSLKARGTSQGVKHDHHIPADRLIQDQLDEEPVLAWALRLRNVMEEPTSGFAAGVVSTIVTISILLSMLIMLLKPLICERGAKGKDCRDHDNFKYPDLVLCCIFTVEYFTRLTAACGLGCAEIRKFLKGLANTFDIIAVMPTWLEIGFDNASGAFLAILRLCRFLKLARIARVMKFKDSLAMQKYASARVRGVVEPVCIVFMVIWAILLKETLAD